MLYSKIAGSQVGVCWRQSAAKLCRDCRTVTEPASTLMPFMPSMAAHARFSGYLPTADSGSCGKTLLARTLPTGSTPTRGLVFIKFGRPWNRRISDMSGHPSPCLATAALRIGGRRPTEQVAVARTSSTSKNSNNDSSSNMATLCHTQKRNIAVYNIVTIVRIHMRRKEDKHESKNFQERLPSEQKSSHGVWPSGPTDPTRRPLALGERLWRF